jgi:gamma-glutamyltranspeptidase/glutathione hydrolase
MYLSKLLVPLLTFKSLVNKMNNYMNKAYKCVLATILLLATSTSCTSLDRAKTGRAVFSEEFYGLITADEPQSVLVGKEILGKGGNAVDASVAMALAMSVSYPSKVSLTGGGVCQFYNPEEKNEPRVSTIEFLPNAVSGEKIAVPALPRGLFALFAKGGSLRWEELVVPAENLARFGMPLSRALARDLNKYVSSSKTQQNPDGTIVENDVIKAFSTSENSMLKEGDLYKQLELSSVLTTIRTKGVGEFYSGLLEKRLVSLANDAGHKVSYKDFYGYSPVWKKSVATKELNETIYKTPYEEKQVFDGSFGAGFVVTDLSGKTVSCSLTNGGLFGIGEKWGNTGLFFSSPVDVKQNNVSNVVVVNENSKEFRFASAGFGKGLKHKAYSLAKALSNELENVDLEQESYKIEQAASGEVVERGLINFTACPKGATNYADLCVVRNDGTGAGMSRFLGAGVRKARIFETGKNKLVIESKKKQKSE